MVAAARAGLSWVEFDVRLTSDDILIVFHDDALDRTTNGSGLIHESTSEYLKTLDAGSWFSPLFQQERIPVFSEILPTLLSLGLYCNIELKTPPNPTPAHVTSLIVGLIETLNQCWPSQSPLPLVSSFDWTLLPPVRAALPDIPLGYLTETPNADMIDQFAAADNCALHCDYQALTPALIQQANAVGLPLLAYTVNDPEKVKQLISQGVLGIFTDNANQS